MSRKVSPQRGRPPRTSGRLTSPTEGLLTRHSRCLGSYVLFVFLGRVSRASVSARVPWAKSSTSRLEEEERRRRRDDEGDGDAGGDAIAREREGKEGVRGGARRRQGAGRVESRYNAAHLAAGGWGAQCLIVVGGLGAGRTAVIESG